MRGTTRVDAGSGSSDHGAIADTSPRAQNWMEALAEWVAAHALFLWVLLLLLALLAGDLAWQHNVRWQRRTRNRGETPLMLRPRMGLILAILLALAFVAIAFAVGAQQGGKLIGFDTDLAEQLRAQLPVSVLQVIAVLTHLGDLLWVAPASAVIALLLWWRRQRQLAGIWIIALLGILPINGGLKALFQRVRPLHDHGFIIEPGWSFPSGHAFGAMVFYGMLAYVLLRLTPRFHRAIIAATIVLIGVIGISRILLQVHYFSDVLAGYAAGAAWLVLCIGAAEALRQKEAGTPVQSDR
ncbi:phosphatase PAP2 family protein [Rhodanobacter sp. AS-Z3]|uniref:phosphatase PAP2 family protein n=1 Tax=Rhodanobacter sp. AS-Z3 TaxID=3031330 RepID=UPI0024788E38|nr:phosphatase PAP2 family protein [Rhodanobacter sp. AS-Z3]WEN13459.1 phosphatase PAP2 family protein [Rhodanobacter sp. AS-Z3]